MKLTKPNPKRKSKRKRAKILRDFEKELKKGDENV